MPTTQKFHHGFSLIEVMVAFAILSTAIIALSASFPFGSSINKGAENASIASFLAQEKIENIISSGYNNIAVGVLEEKHRLASDANNYLYYYQREAAANYVDGNLTASSSETGLKKIFTAVYYQEPAGKTEKAYNITTLVSQK